MLTVLSTENLIRRETHDRQFAIINTAGNWTGDLSIKTLCSHITAKQFAIINTGNLTVDLSIKALRSDFEASHTIDGRIVSMVFRVVSIFK